MREGSSLGDNFGVIFRLHHNIALKSPTQLPRGESESPSGKAKYYFIQYIV